MPDQRRTRRPGTRPGAGRPGAKDRSRGSSPGSRDARGARSSTAGSAKRTSATGSAKRTSATGSSRSTSSASKATAVEAKRPRFTGRAAVLVLVLAVLAVSYASSLRAYLQQKSEIDDLRDEIATSQAGIDDLQREKARWQDPAYVAAQARERFGYVKPGETPFVVVDENGDPVDPSSTLSDPDSVSSDPAPTAWYSDVWGSVKVAGNPPTKSNPPPATEIDGSDEPTGE